MSIFGQLDDLKRADNFLVAGVGKNRISFEREPGLQARCWLDTYDADSIELMKNIATGDGHSLQDALKEALNKAGIK